MKCSLTRVEITFAEMVFAGKKCWLRCWMKCWLKCWLTIWWSFCRIAFNADASDAQTSFRILSENCIWLWNNQMHWRVFDFVRRLHLTLKRSNALTNFRVFVKKLHLILKQSNALTNFRIFFLSEGCIWFWNNQMHWRVDYDFAVSITSVVARFWLMTQTDRQTNKQTNRRAKRQMKRCLLTVKTGKWFAKNDEKRRFNRDVVMRRAESTVSKTTDRDIVMRRARSFEKKNQRQWNCQQNSWSWRFYETCQLSWKKRKNNTSIWSLHSQKKFFNLWHRT